PTPAACARWSPSSSTRHPPDRPPDRPDRGDPSRTRGPVRRTPQAAPQPPAAVHLAFTIVPGARHLRCLTSEVTNPPVTGEVHVKTTLRRAAKPGLAVLALSVALTACSAANEEGDTN